jgi:hypothetical protein
MNQINLRGIMLKIIVSTIIIVGAMLTPAFAEKAAPETKVYTSNAYGDSSYYKKYCPVVTRGFAVLGTVYLTPLY